MGGNESKYDKYDPQPSLKGRLYLLEDEDEDGDNEKIIATFRFEPCEWQKILWGSKEHPVPLGSVDGLGHLTNKRIVLFWDTKSALSAETVHNAGEAACKIPRCPRET